MFREMVENHLIFKYSMNIQALCGVLWLLSFPWCSLSYIKTTNTRKMGCMRLKAEVEDSTSFSHFSIQLRGLIKNLTTSLVYLSLLAPVHARSEFMSPEAEGGGGRFGRSVSQTSVLEVQSKIAANTQSKNGFQTKSGLKYFDIRVGEGKSPRYGDLVTFQYFLYYKPADRGAQLELVTKSNEPYLQKHGNGRIVRGLDEGIHTMKEGGRRRIIVPKNIGYTSIGVGPLPAAYSERQRLGTLIDVLQEDQGELIFDVELEQVKVDENDQGYYDDIPVTQDEVRELVTKTLGKNRGITFEEKIKKNSSFKEKILPVGNSGG